MRGYAHDNCACKKHDNLKLQAMPEHLHTPTGFGLLWPEPAIEFDFPWHIFLGIVVCREVGDARLKSDGKISAPEVDLSCHCCSTPQEAVASRVMEIATRLLAVEVADEVEGPFYPKAMLRCWIGTLAMRYHSTISVRGTAASDSFAFHMQTTV